MGEDMLTDITLDHLPDLSDASVSFQIPAHDADAADLLLADRTGSFDLLCRASDTDASFAPVSPRRPRGPPLTLSELTPQPRLSHQPPPSRSPTPTASAVPAVPLALEHCSPRKRQLSPPPACHVAHPGSVSEERLPAQVQALHCQPGDASHSFPDDPAPSSPISNLGTNARPSEGPLREERETGLGCETSVIQDAVILIDNAPPDITDIANPTPRPNVTRNPRTTAIRTVAAGGIFKRASFSTAHVSKKTKNKPSLTREAHNVLPARQLGPAQPTAVNAIQELVPPAKSSGDSDSGSKNTQIIQHGTGGLADRLVSYSQRLISSIGLYKPYSESSPGEATEDAVRVGDATIETRTPAAAPAPSPPHETMNDIRSTRHEPLRLSEISPYKPPLEPSSPGYTGNLQDSRSAVSPTRPAKRRASTDADLVPDGHLRKKGKTMTTDREARGLADGAVSQGQTRVQDQHEVTHGRSCGSTGQVESTMPSARTKYRSRFNFSSGSRGPTLDPFPYLSRSRQVRKSWIKGKRSEGPPRSGGVQNVRHDERTRDENVVRSCHGPAREPFGAGDLPLIEKKQNGTLSVPLTKPVGFTFRVDARLEARKEERLAASEPGQALPERCEPKQPRFASLRGRPPSLASVPVVPFNFCTEQRAREREKFDAMVRRKEEEAERVKEAVRQQEAEAEEREIRELRRRAVPKANAIPEWYADMPKRRPA